MKYKILFLTIFFVTTNSCVYAAKNENTNSSQKINQPINTSVNQVTNQNQVKTQNQGEDSQLQVSTQEKENIENSQGTTSGNLKEISPRNATAEENRSIVSKKVEELLTKTEGVKNGLGEEIRTVAQNQKNAQGQIDSNLEKINNRNKLVKYLIGPDFKAMKDLAKQINQNQSRIQQLLQIKTQLTNEEELQAVTEAISSLESQNINLQEQISLEEKNFSLFGWFFKLFNN